MEDKLNSKAYQTVSQRMQTEEATCALTMNNHPDDGEYVYNFKRQIFSRTCFNAVICNVTAHSMAMMVKLAEPVQLLLHPLVQQEKVVNHNHCWNH